MADLPKTITRHCCSGKPCTTDLYLDTIHPAAAPGEPELPAIYAYRRSNDNLFSDWASLAATRIWLQETEPAAE